MDRRHFLSMLGLGAVGLTLPGVAQADILKQAAANPNIKPISGSWFEFQHPGGKEGVYWDKDLRQFTAAQWREKIREISETGMEYLVMMNVAAHVQKYSELRWQRMWLLTAKLFLIRNWLLNLKWVVKILLKQSFLRQMSLV